MPGSSSSQFERDRMAECLIGQARLCERIASSCVDEKTIHKFKQLAKDCKEAAATTTE